MWCIRDDQTGDYLKGYDSFGPLWTDDPIRETLKLYATLPAAKAAVTRKWAALTGDPSFHGVEIVEYRI